MKRSYIYRDGIIVDKATGFQDLRGSNLPPQAPMLALNNAYSNNPIKSPVDGSVISTRQDLREHNKRNDVVDIGNDREYHPDYQEQKSYEQKNAFDNSLEKDIKNDLIDTIQKFEQNHEPTIQASRIARENKKTGNISSDVRRY